MISLGCAKNLVDSEVMLGELRRQGSAIVHNMDDADTIIVNTCAFIDEAKQESIDTILEVAARKGKGVTKLLVAGCMVNRYGPELVPAWGSVLGGSPTDDYSKLVAGIEETVSRVE